MEEKKKRKNLQLSSFCRKKKPISDFVVEKRVEKKNVRKNIKENLVKMPKNFLSI